MTIQEALKKAIENGYEFYSNFCLNNDFHCSAINDWELFCIDPKFWICLFGDKEFGKMSAKRFIENLFEGKTAEDYFDQLQ